MTTTDRETVPLPESLQHCECPKRGFKKHLPTCVPAREHDAIPLRDRPEYEEGRSFETVSWDYPFRFEATVRVTVEVDPVLYIEKHRAEYEEFVMQRGFEPWEKPAAFIAHKVAEEAEEDAVPWSFSGGRHVSMATAWLDEVEESPRWKLKDFEAFEARLVPLSPPPPPPPIVDPNQGTLLEP